MIAFSPPMHSLPAMFAFACNPATFAAQATFARLRLRYAARGGSLIALAYTWRLLVPGVRSKRHQQIGRFGRVWLKLRRFRAGPFGEVHHDTELVTLGAWFSRLNDVEAAAVKEIGVISEQLCELGDQRMIRRNCFGIYLA